MFNSIEFYSMYFDDILSGEVYTSGPVERTVLIYVVRKTNYLFLKNILSAKSRGLISVVTLCINR